MKILLLNDTALVPHAGCQAVSDAHARMLGRRGHEIAKRYFLGELGEYAEMGEAEAISAILRSERLMPELQSVDAVVLNGEGTIHHGAGRQWLALLGAAQRCGKATILANAVFEETFGYDAVLQRLDDFVVRDERSATFARSRGFQCRVVLDSCLEAQFTEPAIELGPADVLVTDWHDDRHSDVGISCLSFLQDPSYQSAFLPLHAAEARLLWRRYPATMARYAVAVTGRHHGVYFSILARRPFVPLASNSQKVEGFLDFVKAPFGVATTGSAIVERLAWAKRNPRAFEEIFDKVQAQRPLDTFAELGGSVDPSGEEREIERLARDVGQQENRAADAEWSVAATNRRLKLAVSLRGNIGRSAGPSAEHPRREAQPQDGRLAEAICVEMLNSTPDEPAFLLVVSRACAALGCHRQAYVAVDRLINIDRHNAGAWQQLLQIVPEADLELAYWIGLKASWSQRVDVMAAATHRLVSNRAPASRIAEVFPGNDWPRSISDRFWEKLGSGMDAGQPAEFPSFIRQSDRLAHAESLLGIAPDPRSTTLEASLALASSLESQFRYSEAREVAVEAAVRWPEAPGPRLALARAQLQLGNHQEAARTLQELLSSEPENPRAWLEYGQLSRATLELPVGTADHAFARLSDLAGNDRDLIDRLVDYFLSERDFGKAAAALERRFSIDPLAIDDPSICRSYARCLRNLGQIEEAAKTIERGLEACRRLAQTAMGEDWEIGRRGEACLLSEGGHNTGANEALRSIRIARSSASWAYDRPEYLPATRLRLRGLQEIVASRDIIAFAHGPSFIDFASHLDEIADVDFATATIGAFPPVDEELTRRVGRGIDVLLLTPPNRVRAWFKQLQEFLERPSPNMLITSRHAMSALPELGVSESDLVRRYDQRLLYIHPAGGPPLPSRPLHFEHGNSLALLLPLLVLSRPRRIFLVGADGGAQHRLNRPYFFHRDIDATGPDEELAQRPDMAVFQGKPDRLAEANRRWRNEAAESDNIIRSALRHLALIFDVPTPPVFNVCPHSSHAAFAKIDYDEAVAMIRDQPARARRDQLAADGRW